MLDADRPGDGAAIAFQRDHANLGERVPECGARAIRGAVVDDDHGRSFGQHSEALDGVRRFSTSVARDHDDRDVMTKGVALWRDER